MKSDVNVWRLLRRNVSVGQMSGYIVSNIVGLTVILSGLMFYLDCARGTGAGDRFFSRDYIVMSKRVEGLGLSPVTFAPSEIAELEAQPWAKRVGEFTSSRFAVSGEVEMGGRGLSTYLFLESVPDDYFDLRPERWGFDPERRFVPVILSKDYLALYNFGFAVPQGLPQVSEELMEAMPLTLRLSGAGGAEESFDAAIVGFSSRLNTIAVPQEFMDWANRRFSVDTVAAPPSRLIVEIDRMEAGDMDAFLAERGIEASGDNDAEGNMAGFLSAISLVVASDGLIISLLALFILLLGIFLLLQKSREKLRSLMLLGYTPGAVSSYYERLIAGANLAVSVVAVVGALIVRGLWTQTLEALGFGGASPWPVVAVGAAYFVVVTLFNIGVVRRYMKRIWRGA
ncbi:MAG: hypothetical protein NC342_00185 [Pseudoflavonifractor sp.]|nr:ABC transporter permease [Alloprevotella sp.]MCM1115945.1 hypothetical protein [Pseudoflavonifractor sp.]